MENQSRTQEISNNIKKIKEQIKENLNYIYIVLMIIANAILSLLQIKDGEIGINYPTTGLGWLLWATQVLAVTFVGVMILSSFRRQGIKNGHKNIKTTYDEYLDLITKQNNQESNPRGLKEYMNQRALKDGLGKGSIFALINILVISIGISANLNALLALIVNILLATCFGIKAMLDAEDYVITELVVWYKIKIKEMLELKEDIKNAKIRRNKKSGSRHSKSSGVQQREELNAGQPDSDTQQPSESVVVASSSGLLA